MVVKPNEKRPAIITCPVCDHELTHVGYTGIGDKQHICNLPDAARPAHLIMCRAPGFGYTHYEYACHKHGETVHSNHELMGCRCAVYYSVEFYTWS